MAKKKLTLKELYEKEKIKACNEMQERLRGERAKNKFDEEVTKSINKVVDRDMEEFKHIIKPKQAPLVLSNMEWLYLMVVLIIALIAIWGYGIRAISQDSVIAENKSKIAQLELVVQEKDDVISQKDMLIDIKENRIKLLNKVFEDCYRKIAEIYECGMEVEE